MSSDGEGVFGVRYDVSHSPRNIGRKADCYDQI